VALFEHRFENKKAKQIFEHRFENQKSQTKSRFFRSETLGSGKTLSELHIITNLFWQESMNMQDAQNIAKILLLP